MKLFSKLFLGFFLVALIPVLGGIYLFSHSVEHSSRLAVENHGRLRVQAAVGNLVLAFEQMDSHLATLARSMDVGGPNESLLILTMRELPDLQQLLLVDRRDRVVSGHFRYGYIAPGTPVEHRDIAGDCERLVSFSNWNLEPRLTLVYPLRDFRTGEFQGTLEAEISLKNLFLRVSDREDTGRVRYVVDDRGRIVSHTDINLVLQENTIADLPLFAAGLEAGTVVQEEYRNFSGEEVVGSAMKVPGLPLAVVEEVPRRQAYHLVYLLRRQFLVVGLVSAALVLLAAWLISRSITRPLEALKLGAQRVADGDLDVNLELANLPADEIGDCRRYFTRMVAALREDRELRLAARQQLQESEDRYRMVADYAADMEFWLDPDGRLNYVSPSCEVLTGYRPEELIARPELLRAMVVAADRPLLDGHVCVRDVDCPVAELECRIRTRDGELKWIGHVCQEVVAPDGRYLGVRGSRRDITRRKQIEFSLAREREQLAITLRSIGDGVITVDIDGRVLLLSRMAEKLTGWTQAEAIGQPLDRVFHIVDEFTDAPVAGPVAQVIATGRIIELENHVVLVSRDGRRRVIADSAAPVFGNDGSLNGVVLVFRDVTEKERLQRELFKVERIESLGQVAGGIAHDFNNLLMGIGGNLSLARVDGELGARAAERIRLAEEAVQRAASLARQLLTFARGGEPRRETVEIARLVREAADFVLHGTSIRPVYLIDENLPPVHVDADQIGQVIHNLMLNARQMMPAGGDVICRIERAAVTERACFGGLKPGDYVRVKVVDRGPGIPAGVLPRIFEPYFSTRPEGHGLGLATCFSIVRRHDGMITAESPPDGGAKFTFYLPVAADTPAAASPPPAVVGGRGRILVMDDDEVILEIVRGMLEHLGYAVETAVDGAAAVTAYEASLAGSRFAAVITDLTVPGGMGGREVAARLLEIDPDVRMIISSGYSEDQVIAHYREYGFRATIGKPFTLEQLSRSVAEVLADDA